MPITKAVIPAAGLGTRFLPATKVQPKEMIPVVDKPAIQYVVEEAVAAGFEDILMITGRNKRSLEDHFDHAFELESELERTGKKEMLQLVRSVTELATIQYIRQGQALGLGHAVGQAKKHVANSPFAVLLGDDLITGHQNLLHEMAILCEQTGTSVIAVQEFPDTDLDKYGVIDATPDPNHPDMLMVHDLLEKPGKDKAPSNLCIIGRYVLTPDIFEHIENTPPGRGGEIQLTDALKAQANEAPIRAIKFSGRRYDVGEKGSYLKAMVELACNRDDLGPEFREFLRNFVPTLPKD